MTIRKFGAVRAIACAVALAWLSIPDHAASSAERSAQIFDAEIENTIRVFAAPVLRAAGLEPAAVRIHIVRTDALNAFVSRGQRIFLTTGLLKSVEHPGQLIGVLAHETGHIAGGHLARIDRVMRDASTPALLSTIVAVAVGVLARDPAAMIVTSAGANQVITRNLLSFTRAHERSADRAAIRYLNATRQSSKGLLEFLRILDDQTALVISRQRQRDASYEVTHPLTADRIAYIADQVSRSPYSDTPIDPALVAMHDRMRAKLKGFLDPPRQTLRHYKADDPGLPARYARAIAYHRQSELGKALGLIDGLLAERANDPYFRELKGQILFENGRIADSLPEFRAAVTALPDEPLLRVGLAHAQIELDREDLLKPALTNLKKAILLNPFLPIAWRLAATAYGRVDQLGLSALSSAEYNLLVGRRSDARKMAERAQRLLKRGSPGWLRANDVLNETKRQRR